ncbi:putative MCE associated membrane protein [Mycobacterium lentiflavum]|uniref:Putative MCE associated membrane protein n=1 Tax=Mycobacterium lentiflavum TaxID=141349 RepID=A0A0E3WE19_MYCLN|nr:mammalian cell entry protein [Mycobacterium lentiflavum]CQD22682.1 putative MCE associated membrane protein [Mycobacterium lentiflavum]
MSAAIDSELADDEGNNDDDDCAGECSVDDAEGGHAQGSRKPVSTVRLATLFGLVVVAALALLVGWLGFRVHQSQQAQDQRSQFLQAARQGALNLTTIDWQHADSDVRRILDGATGEFYDDFTKRSKPFIEVLKQAKATTVGTITQAGLESATADSAQALVAVSVQTSNAGGTDQVPRAWRMRISVQKVGEQAKVSNVWFVP